MESTIYYSMTIFFLFTTAEGATRSGIYDANNIIPKQCRELLLPENQNKGQNYCTEQEGLYPEELRKEIEEKIGADLSAFAVLPETPMPAPLSTDDCTNVDAQQNCCTQSGWETPTFLEIKSKPAIVVQSRHLVQQVKTVKCAKEGARCFDRLGFLEQTGHITQCKTDYVNQKVYAYNIGLKTFTWVYIHTPTSCSCVISRRSTLNYSYNDSPMRMDTKDDFSMDDEYSMNV